MGEHEPLYSWRTGLPLYLASTGKPAFGAPDDCLCCRCPCVMEEPGLTVERSGDCDDDAEAWFDQIDYWEASHGFGDEGTAPWPWCEIQWTGYQSGDPPAPIAWCYLFHNRQTGEWFSFIDIPPGVGGFGWAGGPYGTNVTGQVACEGGQIVGAFDLAGENGYEGCTASCVIG